MNCPGRLSITVERREKASLVPTNGQEPLAPPEFRQAPSSSMTTTSSLPDDGSINPGAYAIQIVRKPSSQHMRQIEQVEGALGDSSRSWDPTVTSADTTSEATEQDMEQPIRTPVTIQYGSAHTIRTRQPSKDDKVTTPPRCQCLQLPWILMCVTLITVIAWGIGVFLVMNNTNNTISSQPGYTKLDAHPVQECDLNIHANSSLALQCSCFLSKILVTSNTTKALYHEIKSSRLLSNYTGPDNKCQANNIALWWIAMDMASSPMIMTTATNLLQVTSVESQAILQRYGLALLYVSLEGWSTAASEWLGGGSECDWEGISCNALLQVSGIHLSGLGLTGELPGSSFGMFHKLRELNLTANELKGHIPVEVWTLEKLNVMDLSFNKFDGSIPDLLTNLSGLKTLQLDNNKLTGSLPTSLYSLTLLVCLSLTKNSLTGSLSKDIGQLSNLKYFDITGNTFQGTLPLTLGSLGSLIELIAADNGFTGTLPSELGLLSNSLTYLDFDFSSLHGMLPTELGGLGKLALLQLMNNDLTGTLPTEFGQLTRLESMNLSLNNLNGTLPHLQVFTDLDLGGNHFIGTIPDEYCSIPMVTLSCSVACQCCSDEIGIPRVCA